MPELKKKFNEYKKKLFLSNEPIKLIQIPINIRIQTGVSWYDLEKCWKITYKDKGYDFELAHELGHIYLSKILKSLGFATGPPLNVEIKNDIKDFLNALIDGLVDYRLSLFEEFYTLYIKYIDFWLSYPTSNFVSNTDDKILALYLWFYLEFNCVLKQEEKDFRINEIYNFLKRLRFMINVRSNLSYWKFELIDQRLKDFNYIKSTNDVKKIIFFFLIY